MHTTDTAHFLGQLALVTGAASGIGQATAVLLARQGATVIVADLDAPGITATVEAITASGGKAIGQMLDVTSESSWEAAAELISRHTRLSVLVNCAGISFIKSVAEMTLQEWRHVQAVNLDGVFLGTRTALRLMRPTGQGCIVNVASASGLKAAATASAYCASKAAVIMLTKVAALECAQDTRIRVNAIAPGGVKTPIWGKPGGVPELMNSPEWDAPSDAPVGKRFALAEEVARAILFLASEQSSYVTGSVLTIDAGYTA